MQNTHVLIAYRNFAQQATSKFSHVGLGVNALHTARVLRAQGIPADVAGIWTAADVRQAASQPYGNGPQRRGITHCIIEAPWIATSEMMALLGDFPHLQFVTRCHSQIGFLQVEAGAIKLFREAALLQDGALNFTIAANSRRFCRFFAGAYNHRITPLLNLYDLERQPPRRRKAPFANSHLVKIGAFGAIRLMKNHCTAAAVALMIAHKLRLNLEFHINVSREEHGVGVVQSIRNMFAGLSWAKLVEVPWLSWPEFRNYVGGMDLCLQLSYSETFNLVTADAAAECVPSVVGDAIDWTPPGWEAPVDDPEAAAQVGINLLREPESGMIGREHLERYNAEAIASWKAYLGSCRNVAGV